MSMKEIEVDVQPDYLQRLASVAGRPLTGVLELIWNALDADATRVVVSFKENSLGHLESITIADDGHGIDPERFVEFYGHLGGSWKQRQRHSPKGRFLHGSQGKGRFKAFGLGGHVEWKTTYAAPGSPPVRYSVKGRGDALTKIRMSEPKAAPVRATTGTEVTIANLEKDFRSLRGREAIQKVAEATAMYLEQYPAIRVEYDGSLVNPSAAQLNRAEYEIGPVDTDEGPQAGKLVVIEWRPETTRKLYLCDHEGAVLEELAPGVQAPGYRFTAYLKSTYVRQLEQNNILSVGEMLPGLGRLVEAAKKTLRDHFAHRKAQRAADTIRRWQEEQVYPYHGLPASPVESIERQVFDVVALNIDENLPDFGERDIKGRKLTFRLVQQALQESPEALGKILTEVLELPHSKREEFAELLHRTSLSAIINASKVVADRLDFLNGLNKLLFDADIAPILKERTQLHRILAQATWIFGEEHNLMVDDKGLTAVMREVLKETAPEITVDTPVVTETGGPGIIDLMFGRAKKHWGGSEREYLIVELKRPKVAIDGKALQQCWKYADALVRHPKFASTKTRWDFWALSTELDGYARAQCSQKNRPVGLYQEDAEGRFRIWAMDWGTLLREVESRHQFFKEQLNLEVEEDTLAFLKKTHGAYLPRELFAGEPSAKSE